MSTEGEAEAPAVAALQEQDENEIRPKKNEKRVTIVDNEIDEKEGEKKEEIQVERKDEMQHEKEDEIGDEKKAEIQDDKHEIGDEEKDDIGNEKRDENIEKDEENINKTINKEENADEAYIDADEENVDKTSEHSTERISLADDTNVPVDSIEEKPGIKFRLGGDERPSTHGPKKLLKPARKVQRKSSYDEEDETPATDVATDVDALKLNDALEKAAIKLLRRASTDLELSDSDKELESLSYITQPELQPKVDFFEKLGEVPSLSQISDDDLKPTLARVSSKLKTGDKKLDGEFVDPITGVELPSEEEEEEEVEEEESIEQDVESSEDALLSEDPDLLVLLEMEQEEAPPKVLDDTEVFETIFEIETFKEEVVEEEFDWDAYEKQQRLETLTRETQNFLNELIDQAVETAEYIDPLAVLRERLDKTLLLEELMARLGQLESEQRSRRFLNRKVLDYFYRKGKMRYAIDDNVSEVGKEQKKYEEITKNLDEMMGKEEYIKKITGDEIEEVMTTEAHAAELAEDLLQIFEDLARKTFIRDKSDWLRWVINDKLARMAVVREEISEMRCIFIQQQHSNALLTQKIKDMEDLGSGLRMHNYEILQTQVISLSKKIEERNTELNNERRRYNASLHEMRHLDETKIMAYKTLFVRRTAYQELVNQKVFTRQRLYHLKINRIKLRKEVEQLSQQCGLLDKPALMLDFDSSEDKLEAIQRRVGKLRRIYHDNLRKIKILEDQC